MLVNKCIVGELIWLLCWNSKLLETSFSVLLYILVILAKGQFCGIFCRPRLWHNNKAGAWVSPRSGPTFTTSQHIRREERATDSLLAECRSQDDDLTTSYLRPAVTQQPPTPPAPAKPGRKRWGHADPTLSAGGGGLGGETGQSSDLISQEGKEQGGARWIRALPSLYFIPLPS